MTDLTIFEQIKEQLKPQLAAAQFDQLFGQTTADEQGDCLILHPGSDTARGWLESRMHARMESLARVIAGHPVEIRYAPSSSSGRSNGSAPAPAAPAPLPPHPPAVLSTYDPRKRLWAKHELIVSTFYPAYFVARAGRVIGSVCVPFWRHLCDKFDMSKNDHLDWTPKATYTVGHLAAALGWPVTYLSGRLRTCHHFDEALAETGEIIPCCHLFCGARRGKTQTGRDCCHYRIAGALEVLAGEGWIMARKIGADSRDTRFEIQALRFPPFLTPAQLAWLPPKLQETHRVFLHDNGLDFEEWQRGGLSVIGLAGLELAESSFLLPIGIKETAGIGLLMPIGSKKFFFAHNYNQQAVKPPRPSADRSPPAARKRLRGDIDIESD